jgi:hypothetical protein
MFIIFGTPRSGTTLLATSLDQNDQIIVPDETDFIIPMAFVFDRVKDPAQGRRLMADLIVQTERFPITLGRYFQYADIVNVLASVEYRLPDMLRAIYDRVAQVAGRSPAGDKSPNDIVYGRILLKHGLVRSPIKTVHLVRDIRDVLLSLAEAQPQDAPELNRYFARSWAQSNLYLQDMYAGHPDHYLFLRYEDLVADPAAAFLRITDFLGVPYQEKMLDPVARSRRYEGLKHHQHLNQPIRQRRGNWREAMPAELQTRCLVQAREALERFGYPIE